jgi:phosphoesterase RecJ-like protein
LNSEQLSGISSLLSTPKNIVIVTHWSPDGDAMGSSLGLYNYLLKKGHSVQVITPNEYPPFLSWLPGNDLVINHSANPERSAPVVANADLIFCLDFNSLKRIDTLGDEVAKSSARKMIIDHHLQPEDFADFLLHDVQASSTCQLVYDFIEMLGDASVVDRDIANCLYTGIMTDTGSFRFPSTTGRTHEVVAALIGAGADNAAIHNRVYDDSTLDRLRLVGYCLSEKLKVIPELSTGYFSLSEEELKRFNYKKGDTEGVVNYALSIKGIRLAAFFVERDGIVKISLRSKGDFNVNLFSREHFNGGGHANAAGGASELSLSDTVKKFTELLPSYKEQLSQ